MLQRTGLLIEGGAMRSIFAAGALDCFMEKKLEIPKVFTVSAGAYAGMNYISKQKGRIIKTNIDSFRKKEHRYIGLKTLLKTGSFFDMDLLFDKFPNETVPFDYDSFFSSDQKMIMSTANCETGEAIYYDKYKSGDELMQVCRASNSLPLLSPVVMIDDIPMLDGGMIDALPVEKALEEGVEKLIVILTRTKEYRKKDKSLYMFFIEHFYKCFPNFVEVVKGRAARYNRALDEIEKMEEDGKAFVIRPKRKPVDNKETNPDKLLTCYTQGYEMAEACFHELLAFIG